MTARVAGKASDYQITNVSINLLPAVDSRLRYIGPTNQTNVSFCVTDVCHRPQIACSLSSVFSANVLTNMCMQTSTHTYIHHNSAGLLSIPSLCFNTFHVFDCGAFKRFRDDK